VTANYFSSWTVTCLRPSVFVGYYWLLLPYVLSVATPTEWLKRPTKKCILFMYRMLSLFCCWTFLVRRRHWETEHLPSPDRVPGTAFLLPSVIRHCRRRSSESCWKLICLFKDRGAGDLWTGTLEIYWLTNWLTIFQSSGQFCNVVFQVHFRHSRLSKNFYCLRVLFHRYSSTSNSSVSKSKQVRNSIYKPQWSRVTMRRWDRWTLRANEVWRW